MNTDRVNVFNRADNDAVVVGVAHQLKFVFLPAENALLEQHFGRWASVKAGSTNSAQVFLVVGEARAETTHRE